MKSELEVLQMLEIMRDLPFDPARCSLPSQECLAREQDNKIGFLCAQGRY